jgi:hypothetical protein
MGHSWIHFLDWLMDTAISQFVGGSPSIWAFPTVLVSHTVGLALLVGPNVIINLRVLGASPTLPLSELRRLTRLMWIGLGICAVSGVAMFMTDAEHKAGEKVFWIKMGLIIVSFIITYAIRPVLAENRPANLAIPAKTKALAVASLVVWCAVIIFARLMAIS